MFYRYMNLSIGIFCMLDKVLIVVLVVIELMKLLVFIVLNVYYRMLLY